MGDAGPTQQQGATGIALIAHPGDVFAPDEPDDMPRSGALPALPAPSWADARPTPANSATVPSKNFFLIVLRCIVRSSLMVP